MVKQCRTVTYSWNRRPVEKSCVCSIAERLDWPMPCRPRPFCHLGIAMDIRVVVVAYGRSVRAQPVSLTLWLSPQVEVSPVGREIPIVAIVRRNFLLFWYLVAASVHHLFLLRNKQAGIRLPEIVSNCSIIERKPCYLNPNAVGKKISTARCYPIKCIFC